MSDIDDILAQLRNVKKSGNGWEACCPAHDDQHRSLSVTVGDKGRVLLHCHVGCDFESIKSRLTWPQPNGNGRADIVAEYDYHDESGKLLYQVVRFHPKDFRQRRPDGNGGWIWKVGDTRRVLYHLPEVLAAATAGRVVFVVEGEKDVATLEKLGLVATTNAQGAGKWRPEYTESLRGARAVVLPDNDDPGRRHAQQVAASLDGIAASVQVLALPGLPEKGDASDWVGAGGTNHEMRRLVKQAPSWDAELETAAALGPFIDWSVFWDRERIQEEWLYEDVLARGRGHAIYATHKEGKSLLMLHVVAGLATGKEPIVVIYMDYEMTENDLFDRLKDMGYGPESDLSRLRYALLPTVTNLDTANGATEFMELVDGVLAERPDHHCVVIIDTIGRAVAGKENDADTFRDFYHHTGIELKRRGITWARLDHGGKDPGKGQRGTSAKGDDVDIIWQLLKTQNGVCLKKDAARMNWVPEKVTFTMTSSPLSYKQVNDDWPSGTGPAAEALDRLGVPIDAPVRQAMNALKDADEGRRTEVVSAAQKYRRALASVSGSVSGSGNTRETLGNAPRETSVETFQDLAVDCSGNTRETPGNKPGRVFPVFPLSIGETETPSPTCVHPAHRRFWRRGRGEWYCEICRPPVVAEGVEWLTTKGDVSP